MSYAINRAVEAQASVIGAMLLDDAVVGPALSELAPSDFIHLAYRRVFLAFRKLFTDGAPPDLVTVLAELRGDKDHNEDETANLLHQCMEIMPSASNWRMYAKICREEARLHRVSELCDELQNCTSLEEAGAVVVKINDAMVASHRVKAVGMTKALDRFLGKQSETPTYLRWSVPKLDQHIYASKGKFILLGGYPSDGKTSLALAMAWEQAKTLRVGFYSLETDPEELTDRLVAMVAKVPMQRIMDRKMRDQDYKALADKADEMSKRGLILVPAAGMSAQDVMSHALANRLDVVYIDYLQLLSGDPRASRYDQVTQISMDLHRSAQQTGVIVVALSQLNRSEATTAKKSDSKASAPTMRALRESGQLEQDADVILLLYRPYPQDLDNPERSLDIAKNKLGRCGHIELDFDGWYQSFAPHEPTPGEHYRQVQRDIAAAGRGEYRVLPDDEPLPQGWDDK